MFRFGKNIIGPPVPFFTIHDFSLCLILPYKFDVTGEIAIATNIMKFVL